VANIATRVAKPVKSGKPATHGASSARAAGLHYADPDLPGLSRARRGRAFVYRTAKGKLVRDARTLNRIYALVLPPAWTDVWISPDPRAHLQATGRDAKGRKQYRYHPLWTAERDSNKYDRMLEFAAVLPEIRRRTRRDLMNRASSWPRVLATVVALLERTHIRVGNEEYARTNKSHGLTTLLDRHVKVRGKTVRFAFRGKSGVSQTVDLEDATLAKAVRECQDLPGQTLFQYRDDDGTVKSVSSTDVNDYLREVSGGEFTAKDFRTWGGTLSAAKELDGFDPPASETAGKRDIVAAIDRVAETLGNTRAVCRKCYIHPAVLVAFQAGLTIGRVSRRRSSKGLREAEAKLVALLLRMDQKKAA
jgi:DNA topoisomerase-1